LEASLAAAVTAGPGSHSWDPAASKDCRENVWLKLLALLLAVILFALSRQPPTDVRWQACRSSSAGLNRGLKSAVSWSPPSAYACEGRAMSSET
jgi:hypothetical protein